MYIYIYIYVYVYISTATTIVDSTERKNETASIETKIAAIKTSSINGSKSETALPKNETAVSKSETAVISESETAVYKVELNTHQNDHTVTRGVSEGLPRLGGGVRPTSNRIEGTSNDESPSKKSIQMPVDTNPTDVIDVTIKALPLLLPIVSKLPPPHL
jgi:hypothetical protein